LAVVLVLADEVIHHLLRFLNKEAVNHQPIFPVPLLPIPRAFVPSHLNGFVESRFAHAARFGLAL
jgi:hypothetical protein